MKKKQQEPRRFLFIAVLTILLSAIASQYRLGFLPRQEEKEISISTFCTGFLAKEVEEEITSPLEKVLLPLPGLENIHSVSTRGKSTIYLSFPRDSDMKEHYLTIRDRIEGVSVDFPSSVERPRIRFSSENREPVFMAFFQRAIGYSKASVTRLFTDLGPERSPPQGARTRAGAEADLSGIGEIIVRGDTKTEVLYRISPSSRSLTEISLAELGSFIQDTLTMKRVTPENTFPIILRDLPTTLKDLRQRMFPGGIRTETLFTLSNKKENKESRARVNAAEVISVIIIPSAPDMTIRLCKNLEKVIEDLEGVEVGFNKGKIMERELRRTFVFLMIMVLTFYLSVFLVLSEVKKPGDIFSISRLRKIIQKPATPLFISCFRVLFILLSVAAALTISGKPVTFITLISLFPVLTDDGTIFNWSALFRQHSFRQNRCIQKIPSLLIWLPFFLYSSYYPPFLSEAFIVATSGTLGGTLFYRIMYGKGKETAPSYKVEFRRGFLQKIIILGLGLLTIISVSFLIKHRGTIGLEEFNPTNNKYLRFKMEYPEGTTTEYAASRGLAVEKLLLENDAVESIISGYRGDSGECTILLKSPKEANKVVRALDHLSEGFGKVYFHILGKDSEAPDIAVTFTAGEDSLLLPAVQVAATSISSMEGVWEVLYNFKPALPYLTVIFDQKKCFQSGVTPIEAQRGLFPFLSSPIIARWTSKAPNTVGFQTKDIRFAPVTPLTAKSLPSFPVKTSHGLIPLHSVAEFAPQIRKKTIFHHRGVPSLTFSIIVGPEDPKKELVNALDARFTRLKERGELPQNLNWEIRDLRSGGIGKAVPKAGFGALLPCIIIFALLSCLFLSRTASLRLSFILTALFFNGFALLLLLLWLLQLTGGAVLLGILFAGARGIERTTYSLFSLPPRWIIGVVSIPYPLLSLLVSLLPFLGMSSMLIPFLWAYFLGTIIFSLLIPFSLTLFYTD